MRNLILFTKNEKITGEQIGKHGTKIVIVRGNSPPNKHFLWLGKAITII